MYTFESRGSQIAYDDMSDEDPITPAARLSTSRACKLTADNKKTESLAIPTMVPLYETGSRFGGRMGALSTSLLGSFASLAEEAIAKVCTPALVIAGSRDTVAGSPVPLDESIPGGKAAIVPGCSHRSCVTDSFFKGAVLGFLGFP